MNTLDSYAKKRAKAERQEPKYRNIAQTSDNPKKLYKAITGTLHFETALTALKRLAGLKNKTAVHTILRQITDNSDLSAPLRCEAALYLEDETVKKWCIAPLIIKALNNARTKDGCHCADWFRYIDDAELRKKAILACYDYSVACDLIITYGDKPLAMEILKNWNLKNDNIAKLNAAMPLTTEELIEIALSGCHNAVFQAAVRYLKQSGCDPAFTDDLAVLREITELCRQKTNRYPQRTRNEEKMTGALSRLQSGEGMEQGLRKSKKFYYSGYKNEISPSERELFTRLAETDIERAQTVYLSDPTYYAPLAAIKNQLNSEQKQRFTERVKALNDRLTAARILAFLDDCPETEAGYRYFGKDYAALWLLELENTNEDCEARIAAEQLRELYRLHRDELKHLEPYNGKVYKKHSDRMDPDCGARRLHSRHDITLAL